jgi:DNA-directed RNA polymerase subunit RPC12/RpoP
MVSRGFEKFLCAKCDKEYLFPEINRKWKCSQCNSIIKIKAEIGDYTHTCYVLKASEIDVDMLVTLDNENSHLVLAVNKEGSSYRIALKEFKVITLQENDFVVTIDGGWYE